MDFPETIQAQNSGLSVRLSPLVFFDFASGAGRYWFGFGRLKTNDDHLWVGTNDLASLGNIDLPLGGQAPEQTFTLSGVDSTFVAKAKADPDEYRNRTCTVFLQWFNDDWSPLDLPFAFWVGRMAGLSVSQSADDQGFTRTITLRAESLFAGRKRPVFGRYTDRDQQARYPGDKGCERTAGIQQKRVTFPDY